MAKLLRGVFNLDNLFNVRLRLLNNIRRRLINRCNKTTSIKLIYKTPFLSSFAFIPTVSAFGFGKSKKEEIKEEKKSPEAVIIEEADNLYSENAIDALYTHLIQYKESNNAEILWRLCRAACDKAKSSENANQKKQLMYEAYDFIKKAVAMNDNLSAVHKWYAIMLDYVGEYEGKKQRISNAFKVKEHFMKAIELNPTDATSVHLLGYWCFVFAELPWYQQKVASVIFTTPPSSTYEEALEYFLKAEKIDPNFYSMNLLCLGKTYLRLNNKDMAKCYLARVLQYQVKTPDDKQAHKEAADLIKSL